MSASSIDRTIAWYEIVPWGTNETDDDGDGLSECAGDCDDSDPQCTFDCTDADGDGIPQCAGDCDDSDDQNWSVPGEATDLVFLSDGQSLLWSPPATPGGISPYYDLLRSGTAADFVTATTCIESNDGADTQALDPDSPPPGSIYYYLACAENACGRGPAGKDSAGAERLVLDCP
jgi:hypothetical protein